MTKPARTILVVDDVPMFRDLVSVFLTRTARVLTADSAQAALRIARREPLDLLISDMHMPGMDGAELCASVKRDPQLAGLPVLMLLRGNDACERERAVHAGADDVLAKPLCRGALIECVNHFLESGLSCGLPRVGIATPVHMRNSWLKTWGTARNISRGGILVEADCEFEPKSSVVLDLHLPDTSDRISPLAELVWSRETKDQRLQEMGFRFLSVDRYTMTTINDFLSQHLPQPETVPGPIHWDSI